VRKTGARPLMPSVHASGELEDAVSSPGGERLHAPSEGGLDVRSALLAHPGRVLESAAAPWPFGASGESRLAQCERPGGCSCRRGRAACVTV
jgi:hypothetical protein